MDSWDRLRMLRRALQLVDSEEAERLNRPSLALVIPGIDGDDNYGSSVLIKWLLLGCTGQTALEPTVDADHEAVEDCVLGIALHGITIYHTGAAKRWIEPAIAHWRGVHSHFLHLREIDDSELAELFKIKAFVNMVQDHRHVAVPVADVDSIERWPLIQSYGLADLGTGGFFSMRHQVHSCLEAVISMLHHVDAPHLRSLLSDALPTMEQQWRQALYNAVPRHRRPGSLAPPPRLTESALCEPLLTFAEFAAMRRPLDSSLPPEARLSHAPHARTQARAVFGMRTLDPDAAPASGTLETAGVEGAPAVHFLLEAEDPSTGLHVTRTYFNRADRRPPREDGGGGGGGGEEEGAIRDAAFLKRLYGVLVRSHQAAVRALEGHTGLSAALSSLPLAAQEEARKPLAQVAAAALSAALRPWTFPAARQLCPPSFVPQEALTLRLETRSAQGTVLGVATVRAVPKDAGASVATSGRRATSHRVEAHVFGDSSLAPRGVRPMFNLTLELAAIPQPSGGGGSGPSPPLLGSLAVGDTVVVLPRVDGTKGGQGDGSGGQGDGKLVASCLTDSFPYMWSRDPDPRAGLYVGERRPGPGEEEVEEEGEEGVGSGDPLGQPLDTASAHARLLTGGTLEPYVDGRVELHQFGFRFRCPGRAPLSVDLRAPSLRARYWNGDEAAAEAEVPLRTASERAEATSGWLQTRGDDILKTAYTRWRAAEVGTGLPGGLFGGGGGGGDSASAALEDEAVRRSLQHAPDMLLLHHVEGEGEEGGLSPPPSPSVPAPMPAWSVLPEEQGPAKALAILVSDGSQGKTALLQALRRWHDEGLARTREEDKGEGGVGVWPTGVAVAYRAAAAASWEQAWRQWAVVERARIGDALVHSAAGAEWAEAVQPGSIPVTVFVHLPNSAAEAVARLVASFTSADASCRVVVAAARDPVAALRDAAQSAGAHRQLLEAATELRASASSSPLPPRILWVAPPWVDAAEACAWVAGTGAHEDSHWHVHGCVACISPRGAVDDVRRTRWVPRTVELATAGFTSSVLLTQAEDSPPQVLEQLRAALQRHHPGVEVRPVQGGAGGPANQPHIDHAAARSLLTGRGKRGWDDPRSRALRAWAAFGWSRGPGAIPTVVAECDAVMRGVRPEWIAWPKAVAASSITSTLQRLVQPSRDTVALALVEGGGGMGGAEEGREGDVKAWAVEGALRVVTGGEGGAEWHEVRGAGGSCGVFPIDATRKAQLGSQWSPIIAAGGLAVWMRRPVAPLTGRAARDNIRHQLERCRPIIPEELPQRTIDTVTQEEKTALRRLLQRAPAPEGYVFDGAGYLDYAGRRQADHPHMDRVITAFLRAVNNAIHDWNEAVRGAQAAKEAEDRAAHELEGGAREPDPRVLGHPWWSEVPTEPPSSAWFLPEHPRSRPDCLSWADAWLRGSHALVSTARTRRRQAPPTEFVMAGAGGGGGGEEEEAEEEDEDDEPFVLGHRVPGLRPPQPRAAPPASPPLPARAGAGGEAVEEWFVPPRRRGRGDPAEEFAARQEQARHDEDEKRRAGEGGGGGRGGGRGGEGGGGRSGGTEAAAPPPREDEFGGAIEHKDYS